MLTVLLLGDGYGQEEATQVKHLEGIDWDGILLLLGGCKRKGHLQ